jgi:hypothetical protein
MVEQQTEISPAAGRLPVRPWPRISPPRGQGRPLFPGWGVKL